VKKIIRLTESELYSIIAKTTKKLIREEMEDNTELLERIAELILAERRVEGTPNGDNVIELTIEQDFYCDVHYYIDDDSYFTQIEHHTDYYSPPDTWDLTERFDISVEKIDIVRYDEEGEEMNYQIQDSGDIVKNAILRVLDVNHSDAPTDFEKYAPDEDYYRD
jgi:hypothetical protein